MLSLLGPDLPTLVNGFETKLSEFAMVSSQKGIVVIGGNMYHEPGRLPFTGLMELSGHSINTLKWTILEQGLKHARWQTWAFSISQQALTELSDEKFKNPTNK